MKFREVLSRACTTCARTISFHEHVYDANKRPAPPTLVFQSEHMFRDAH